MSTETLPEILAEMHGYSGDNDLYIRACADRIAKAIERASVPVAWRWRRKRTSGTWTDWCYVPDEKTARAWCDAYCNDPTERQPVHTAPGVPTSDCPEGWQLVPKSPTQAMLDVGYLTHQQGRGAKSTWAEMLAAAPLPPAPETRDA